MEIFVCQAHKMFLLCPKLCLLARLLFNLKFQGRVAPANLKTPEQYPGAGRLQYNEQINKYVLER